MFVDDSVTGSNVHRRSTTEDDNPPSPMVNLDNMDVFNISQSHQSTGSPGGRRAEVIPYYYINFYNNITQRFSTFFINLKKNQMIFKSFVLPISTLTKEMKIELSFIFFLHCLLKYGF
jgi:hypothetical protein